jgi:hypothetical protein
MSIQDGLGVDEMRYPLTTSTSRYSSQPYQEKRARSWYRVSETMKALKKLVAQFKIRGYLVCA